MTVTPTPLDEADNYAQWIKRGGLSDTTKVLYPQRVRRFLSWLDEQGDEYDGALTDAHVRDWAVRDYATKLREVDKVAVSTAEQALSAIGNFYVEYLQLGKPNVPRSRPPKGAPKGLPTGDARKVLRVAEKRGIRDYALTSLTLFCAVRVAEVVALDTDDVLLSSNSGQIEVRHGKGGVHRRVPVPANARTALRPWLAERQEKYGREVGPLFMSREGGRLSKRRAQSLMGDIGTEAGVHLSPHMLRHTFAQNFLASGGDIATLQAILGHKHLSSTQVYLEPNFDRIAELAERVRIEL